MSTSPKAASKVATTHQCPFCLRQLPWSFDPLPIVLLCCGKYACEPCAKPLLPTVGWTCLGCFSIQKTAMTSIQYRTALTIRADPNKINCYRSQITLGCLASNSEEAIHFWLQAEAGALKQDEPLPPIVQHKLGMAWESGTLSGESIKDSNREAAKWYNRAAGQGYALAMFKMGTLHEQGKGLPQSHAAASGWFGKAAEAGLVSAMRRLGIVMNDGMGQAEPNPESACIWWRMAADKGDVESMVLLGRSYLDGCGGVPKSDKEAVILFNRAANLGNGEAMYLLAESFRHGRGVPKRNLEQCVHWLKKSATVGYFGAVGMLRVVGAVSMEGGVMRYVKRPTMCNHCEKSEKQFEDVMLMCRRCSSVGYCSEMCKQLDFRARHRAECGTLRQPDEEENSAETKKEDAWSQFQSDAGDWYWYNRLTAESSWTKPKGAK